MPTTIPATLAQNSIFNQLQNATPAPLPEAGGFGHYLFEDPWLLAIGAVLFGIGLLYALRGRGQPRAGMVAAVVGFVIAAGVVALAQIVRTDREALLDETRRLVEAGFKGDAAVPTELLADDVTLTVLTRPWDRDKTRLVEEVRTNIAKRHGVDDMDIRGVRATIDGPRAGRSQVSVTAKAAGFPVPTVWLLSWRQQSTDGPWRVWRIEAQQIGTNADVRDFVK